ncbi:MAG: putative porin [Bacteroidia bacterium]
MSGWWLSCSWAQPFYSYSLRDSFQNLTDRPLTAIYADEADTLSYFVQRIGYFKPYGRLFYHFSKEKFFFPQHTYVWQDIPYAFTRGPYTRIDFDQMSARTQNLYVVHAQNLGAGGGIGIFYRRRSREGQYIYELTDHYHAGATIGWKKKSFWAGGKVLWHQLKDQIHGGSILEGTNGFEKARQPMYLLNASVKNFFRQVQVEIGFDGGDIRGGVIGEVGQIVYVWDWSGLQLASYPFWPGGDSSGAPMNRKENYQSLSGWIGVGRFRQGVSYKAWDISMPQGGYKGPYWETQTSWQKNSFSFDFIHRRWKNLPSESEAACRVGKKWYGLAVVENRHPFRGVFFRSFSFPSLWRVGVESGLRILKSDPEEYFPTAYPVGFQVRVERLWNLTLLEAQPQLASGAMYGAITQGRWAYFRRLALVQGEITLQKWLATGKELQLWAQTVPTAWGWVDVSLRFHLRKASPAYYVGMRLWGFSGYEGLFYDPRWGIFWRRGNGYLQGYAWAEPFLAIHLRQGWVFLRMAHMTEGVLRAGYFLTPYYPMPGRTFAFGVQFDLDN